MKLDIDIDEQKKRLLAEASQYQTAIRNQFENSVEKIEKKGTRVLVIGGVIISVYLVLQLGATLFVKKKKEKIEYVPVQNSQAPTTKSSEGNFGIIKMIKESIASFLIEIAKQKLREAIEQYQKEHNK